VDMEEDSNPLNYPAADVIVSLSPAI